MCCSRPATRSRCARCARVRCPSSGRVRTGPGGTPSSETIRAARSPITNLGRVTDITLPAELLPSDGRFGSGPSKVRQEAVAALFEAAPHYMGTSHRRPTVRSVVRRAREGLAELFSLPDGYEV